MVQPQPGNQISRNQNTNQIAIRDLQKKVIEPQKDFIAAAMPKHMQADVLDWLAAASLVIRNDAQLTALAINDPLQLTVMLQKSARYGLTPGTDEIYFVPRGRQIVADIGYRGWVELIRRAGYAKNIHRIAVREGDKFEYVEGVDESPKYMRAPDDERGQLVRAVAWVEYNDLAGGGISPVVQVGKDRIQDAKDASQTARSKYSPWQKYPEKMWLKTALRELAGVVEWSAEERRVTALAAIRERRELELEAVRAETERMQAEVAMMEAKAKLLELQANSGVAEHD